MNIVANTANWYAQLRELRHQPVRDLAWCCFSTPLMANLPGYELFEPVQTEQQLWTWLHHLDRYPDPLSKLISQLKSNRLGLYYESLWRFYFSHHPDWDLLSYNQQIYDAGVTQGAFDFLCRRGSEYFHIETAVKLYLRDAEVANEVQTWQHWIGPHANDRLDIKLKHLQQHQLKLSQQPTAQAYLKTNFPDASDWQPRICMQGYLFYANDQQHPPLHTHPNHLRARWCYADKFLATPPYLDGPLYKILERLQWLSPAQTDCFDELITTKVLLEKIQLICISLQRPLLVATLENYNSLWQETTRIFIVPIGWPHSYLIG